MQHMDTLDNVCKDLGLRTTGGIGFSYIMNDCGIHASKVLLPPDSDPNDRFPNTVGFPCVKIWQQFEHWGVALDYQDGEIHGNAVIHLDVVNYNTVRNAVSKLYEHCPLVWEVVDVD